MQGFKYVATTQEREGGRGLDRAHSELVIRELAKFHAITFCLKKSDNGSVLEKYPYLREDSLYRESTEGFTKRTITPVMASLAELIRYVVVNSSKYCRRTMLTMLWYRKLKAQKHRSMLTYSLMMKRSASRTGVTELMVCSIFPSGIRPPILLTTTGSSISRATSTASRWTR